MDRVFHQLSGGGGSSNADWSQWGSGSLPPLKQGVSSLFGWYAIALNIVNLSANVFYGLRDFDNTETSNKPVMAAFGAMATVTLASQVVTQGTATQFVLSVFNICANFAICVVVMSVVKGEFFWTAAHYEALDEQRRKAILEQRRPRNKGKGRAVTQAQEKQPLFGHDSEAQREETVIPMGFFERLIRAKALWSSGIWVLWLFNTSVRRKEKAAEVNHFRQLARDYQQLEAREDKADRQGRNSAARQQTLRRSVEEDLQDWVQRMGRQPNLEERDYIIFANKQFHRSREDQQIAAEFRERTKLRAQHVKSDLVHQSYATIGAFLITTVGWGVGAYGNPGPQSYNLDEPPYERMQLGAGRVQAGIAYFLAWAAFVCMLVGRNFEYGKAFYKRRQPLKRNEQLANDTHLLDQAADAYAEGYLGKYKTRDGMTKFFVLYAGTCIDNFLSAISLFTASTYSTYVIYQLPNILAGLVSSVYDFILLGEEIRRLKRYGLKDDEKSKHFFAAIHKSTKAVHRAAQLGDPEAYKQATGFREKLKRNHSSGRPLPLFPDEVAGEGGNDSSQSQEARMSRRSSRQSIRLNNSGNASSAVNGSSTTYDLEQQPKDWQAPFDAFKAQHQVQQQERDDKLAAEMRELKETMAELARALAERKRTRSASQRRQLDNQIKALEDEENELRRSISHSGQRGRVRQRRHSDGAVGQWSPPETSRAPTPTPIESFTPMPPLNELGSLPQVHPDDGNMSDTFANWRSHNLGRRHKRQGRRHARAREEDEAFLL